MKQHQRCFTKAALSSVCRRKKVQVYIRQGGETSPATEHCSIQTLEATVHWDRMQNSAVAAVRMMTDCQVLAMG